MNWLRNGFSRPGSSRRERPQPVSTAATEPAGAAPGDGARALPGTAPGEDASATPGAASGDGTSGPPRAASGEGAGWPADPAFGYRIAGLIVLLAVAVAIPAALLVDSRASAALTESHSHRLEAVAQNMAQSLTSNLSSWVRDAWGLSRAAAIRDAGASIEDKRAVLEDFKYRYPEFVWAGYIDARSGLIVAATEGMDEGITAAGKPVLEEGRRGSYVGPVHEVPALAQRLPSRDGHAPLQYVDVAVPVLGAQGGTVVGVIAGILEWSWAERVRTRTQSPGIDMFLVDLSGKIILGEGPATRALPPRLLEIGPEEGATRVRWPEAGEHLTAVASAGANTLYPALGWRVVAHEPMREINAAARRIRQWVALSCVSVGVIAAVLVVFALRRRSSSFGGPPAFDRAATDRTARATADRSALMKDEFIGKLSHELRTPLNAILGWSQLLDSGRLDQAGMKLAAETIRRNVTAQVHLLQNLLDMGRIEEGTLQLSLRLVDLDEIVREAVTTFRPAIDAKRLCVRTTRTGGPWTVDGDGERLSQVVGNLLSNAVRFTADGGCVDLELRGDAQTVALLVSDTGKGIDASQLEAVFSRYKQPDRAGPASKGGLGLGLTIARKLVELHGGSLNARSDGEDHGAVFSLLLPAAASPAGDGAEPSPAPGGRRLGGLRLLVVDDESHMRDLLAHCLGSEGAEVVTAGGVAEAMESLCWRGPFDVMVSDLGMPGEDGISLMRRIRAMPVFRTLPAVAVTACGRDVDRRSALDAGYQAHVGKPLQMPVLVSEIVRVSMQTPDDRQAVNA